MPGPQVRQLHIAALIETSLSSGRDILRGVARYTREVGSWSVYHEPRGLEDDAPSWVKRWNGDGIIARFQNERIASVVTATGIPVVDTLNVVSSPGVPVVHVDNASIAGLAVDHFLDRGFRSFGFCSIRGMRWSQERCKAFKRFLAEAGFACSVYEMAQHTGRRWNWEQRQSKLSQWLEHLQKPAAVMVCSDQRAQFVLDACYRAGIPIPDDVAVLGVDDDDVICEICTPPLSSVQPNHEQVGYLAAELLHKLMQERRGSRMSPDADSPTEKCIYVPACGIHTRLSTDKVAVEEAPVAQAVRFIRDHACEGISAADVVANVPMSRSVLQRHFRKALGHTIHKQIVGVRLDAARSLLLNTNLSLPIIAERAGFKYERYMGLVFNQHEGMPPGAFRRMHGRMGGADGVTSRHSTL